MASRQPATYKDLQRVTGLSLATISKYFNGGNVLAVNREAIEKATEDLGYRMNAFARSLRRGESRTVGVVLPSLLNGFHLSVIVEAEKYLRGEGIGVLVTSNEGDSASVHDAVGLLLDRRVDGIFTVPALADLPALAAAKARGIPVVTVDWWIPELEADSVSLDNVGAGRLAARHLVDHGHKDLAILAGPDSVSTMQERLDGFTSVVTEAELPLPSNHVVRPVLTVEEGYDGMYRLLALSPRPTAVFTANHELTVGALIALAESGLRLGQDISVVGLDAAEIAQTTRPKLTVVAQPVREIAIRAAQILAQRLLPSEDLPAEPVVVRLPARLIAGGSVQSLLEKPA